jgi:integrase
MATKRKTTGIRSSANGKRWRADFKVKDTRTGQWVQKTRTFDTEGAAKRWRQENLVKYGVNVTEAVSTTVGAYLPEWFDFAKVQRKWQGSTQRLHWDIVKQFIDQYGDVPLPKLATRDIDQWTAGMVERGLAEVTICRNTRVISQALSQAVRWNYIRENPVDAAWKASPKSPEITPPTEEEIARLLEAADQQSEDAGMFIHLAVATGARRGELLAIQWSDIDFANSTLTIDKAIGRAFDHSEHVKGTKTGNSRTLTLDAATMARLRAYRESAGADPSPFVFVNESGGHWKTKRGDYLWRKAKRDAGIQETRFHNLRHFHATYLLSRGADLPTLGRRLGHGGGGATTLRVYGHWVKESDTRLADKIGDIFGS